MSVLASISVATVVATAGAGLVSFLSPCSLPLLPAYLAAISGVSAEELSDREAPRRSGFRRRLLVGSTLYVAGFTIVFVLFGLSAGGISFQLHQLRRPVEIIGGVLMVVLGLALLGVLRIGVLERTVRIDLQGALQRRGTRSAFFIGMLFAVGWTPCVGPYLGSALTLATISGTALQGGLLLAIYSLGLGLPFIVSALLVGSLPNLPRRLNRIVPVATRVGGGVTVALGVLVATGAYTHLTSFLASISTPA
ncbi:MAG: cytochrome c biogenesis CcdA family protein [Candidatus Dormibacteria bacterium]